MKNIFIVLFFIFFISCKAQTPTIDRYGSQDYGDIQNAYYKDINNFQAQFVGTWIYTNGSTTLKVVFVKKPMFYNSVGTIKYYADYLIGEYQYIEDGIEKVNSLPDLSTNHLIIYDYNLYSGSQFGNNGYPKCNDCPSDAKRLEMFFDEPANDDGGLSASFVMRRVVENGIEKLKVQFVKTGSALGVHKNNMSIDSTMRDFSLPYGDYTLIKQP